MPRVSAVSGVGTVTGQLARHWGLRPLLGTASSPAKAEFARGYGYKSFGLNLSRSGALLNQPSFCYAID